MKESTRERRGNSPLWERIRRVISGVCGSGIVVFDGVEGRE